MAKADERSPRSRDAQGPLDQGQIVEAAMRLIDETGLEGLSTRRLAATLGISGPSLYWHFKNKRALLEAMAVVLLRRSLPPPNLGDGPFEWREWLAEGARGLRSTALSVRDGAQILAGYEPKGPAYEAAVAAMVATLTRSGLSHAEAGLALRCLGRFAISWVLYEQAADEAPPDSTDEGFEFGLSVFIKGLETRL